MNRNRPPQMRDEFRKELRARLMQEAPIYLTPRRESPWTLRFLRPAMAVGLAGLVLVAGAGTAAAGSLPGDAAFPLKRAFEDLQVTLTFDDVQRVQMLSQIADRRLQELQQVANKDDGQQNNKDEKTVAASEEFAKAVAQFRAAVDAVQQAAPEDKSTAVQNLVDTARDKHEAVLDEVQQKVTNTKAQDAIERAKDEENKDTQDEKSGKDNGKDKKTPRPSRTPTPSRSPRPSETPRATERDQQNTDTPRPAATPRATATGRLTFTPAPPVRQTPGASEKD